MGQPSPRAAIAGEVPITAAYRHGEILLFDDLSSFSQAVRVEAGRAFNFASVTEVSTDFLEVSDQHLILNVKSANGEDPNNLLFVVERRALLFSKKLPLPAALEPFKSVLDKEFGPSTVLAFLTLQMVLASYRAKLEALIAPIKKLDEDFDYQSYRTVVAEFERLDDRLEEFHELLLKLEERGVKQVETEQISFDYSVLIAESVSLEGRCRRRLTMVRDMARDHELRASVQLNKRIERLSDVVRRLTAITVILMMPTMIASHFGMNFAYMPELKVHWAYPAVIGFEIFVMGLGAIVFKKTGWL